MDDSKNLPPYFYRVVDDQSHCKYDKDKGFLASIPNAVYDPKHWKAKAELEQHMDWSNREPTPFISVTCSREKALEYALQRLKNGNVSIAKINSSALPTGKSKGVYHMDTLVKDIGAVIKPEAKNIHEYLCVHQIPVSAIIEIEHR